MPFSVEEARLIELIRLLEARGHVFAQDPLLLTQQLAQSIEPMAERLKQRAHLIDQDGQLRQSLAKMQRRNRFLIQVIMLFWLIMGALSTTALMQSSALNFFALLVSFLGINSVILIAWCLVCLKKQHDLPALPRWLLEHLPQDNVTQATAELYRAEWSRSQAFWQWSKASHQFWLCSLLGIFAATLMMLTIRQYAFNWQSTLLDSQMLAKFVAFLGWLPAHLGLTMPDASVIAQSQYTGKFVQNLSIARQWAGLLLGSLVCYGIVPRLIAWGVCWTKSRLTAAAPLNLTLPYYQAILARWTPVIVDTAHDYQPDTAHLKSPVEKNSAHEGLTRLPLAEFAVLLDSPGINTLWAQDMAGHDWPFWGTLESRDDLKRFIETLKQQPSRVLVGIELRPQTVPDRGLMRQLNQIQAYAQQVSIVLLSRQAIAPERLQQWQAMMTEHELTLLPVKAM